MASAPEQAAAQAEQAVHTAAVAALTALNKLAAAAKSAGVDQEVVTQIDEMSNTVNQVASAVVGNAPTAEPAPSRAEDLGPAIEQFHQEQVAAGPGGAY